MKLLLDEQMPRKLARHFPDGFTVDHVQRNMSHQQNELALPLSVVVLHVYRLKIEDLIPLVPKAIERLQGLSEPAFVRIDAER